MSSRKQSTTKTTTPRKPAVEGPEVICCGLDGTFDMYVDGGYIGSRLNSQDAWIEARRVHFENVEDSAVAVADDAADWFARGV